MEGYQWGEGGGRMGKKVQEIRSISRQGKVKNSIGNVEVKELIGMTHGHEIKEGNVGGREWAGWSGVRGREMGQL